MLAFQILFAGSQFELEPLGRPVARVHSQRFIQGVLGIFELVAVLEYTAQVAERFAGFTFYFDSPDDGLISLFYFIKRVQRPAQGIVEKTAGRLQVDCHSGQFFRFFQVAAFQYEQVGQVVVRRGIIDAAPGGLLVVPDGLVYFALLQTVQVRQVVHGADVFPVELQRVLV